MMTTTLIRNVDWAVAWDASNGRHVYRRNIDIAFADDRIVHVGPRYPGAADKVIDGSRVCVMPGFVDVHSHLVSECIGRGLIEELGNPKLYMSGIFDAKAPFITGKLAEQVGGRAAQLKANYAATLMAISELLTSGVTTIVDLAVAYDGWLDTLAESGIRAYAGPMFREADWNVPEGRVVEYVWDRDKGRRDFIAALAVVDQARAHVSGRLDGIIAPAQVDTCSAEFLSEALAAARDRGMRLTMHCSQSVIEFQEMTRRHGLSPVQWLDRIGVLGPDTLLGHALFLDHHSWVQWPTRRDIDLIVKSGAAVAHCPLVFSRYGQMLEGLGTYIRNGVRVAMGTDTEPHNMMEEIRLAATMARISARNIEAITLSEVFAAATVGGAAALGRDDLGRIAPGAKADLVLLDLDAPSMMPVRDPLRSVVYTAADRGVRDVFVDGRQVVAGGTVLTIDRARIGRLIEEAQEAFMANVPYVDFSQRTVNELTPLSLPLA
ncbi:MAG TPA: amidohydrolase family protein [Stellaceae bacterium]|nr:amidohydrolase family protein [Stellaceae bacterium]